jgi:hypothetical protein
MDSSLLIPNRYKRIGWMVLVPSFILGLFVRFADLQLGFLEISKNNKSLLDDDINLTDELALTGIIIGLLLLAFSREKVEDEYIGKIRLESLQWAVLINYILLIIATWLIHGLGYIDVMMYNMLTVLIIFLIRFHYILRKNQQS